MSKGAKVISKIGGAVDSAASVADHGGHAIDKIRKGEIMGAVKETGSAVKSATNVRKQIERKK